MAEFLKLLTLEAKKIRDPDGADEIVVSRGDAGEIDSLRIRKGDVHTFVDGLGHERLLPFSGRATIEIVLTEVDEATNQRTRIGFAPCSADSLGEGETTVPIGGSGSLYNLTYEVI
jgi:hypothetical protein